MEVVSIPATTHVCERFAFVSARIEPVHSDGLFMFPVTLISGIHILFAYLFRSAWKWRINCLADFEERIFCATPYEWKQKQMTFLLHISAY